jgi:signal transduction histidine kinase
MSSALSTRNEGEPAVEKDSYPQLLSLAVHEFRTPASVVGGYLRMLQRDTDSTLSERQRKMVEEAEKSCARLVAIVAELSDVAKLDAGLIKLAQQPTDAFVLVAEVADLVHEARDRAVRFEARGQADGARMSGDATRLRCAFDAIFRAILREKPGQCVVVAERRIEEIDGRRSAIVIVADEPSVQAAYDREPGLFDEKRGGMGLALPLARRVIEGHGGRVWAPAPLGVAREPGSAGNDDRLARGSAVISLPLTELSR